MTELSGHRPREQRRDTPTPGWESGVWVRIQRSRRNRRLGLMLAAALAVGGAVVSRRNVQDQRGPVRVNAALEGSLRPDGSAPAHALWRLTFEGAELRVYRNALGALHRCPGSPGCIRTEQGGTLTVPLDGPGEYRAVVFSSPLSGGGRTLHQDLTAAGDRDEPVEMSPALVAY
ncbi:MAG TPA: hypothetical protein VLT82_08615 [Myxococcaceae bacterium]|nr:hypothetical protein [Myxococcaceae bacterium]